MNTIIGMSSLATAYLSAPLVPGASELALVTAAAIGVLALSKRAIAGVFKQERGDAFDAYRQARLAAAGRFVQ